MSSRQLAKQMSSESSTPRPGDRRYGAPEHLPVDEAVRTDPISPYAVAKLAGEMYTRAYAEMYGLSQICLALANVYGPRQNPRGEAGVITVFGDAMITDKPATIYGDGTASARLCLRRRCRGRIRAGRAIAAYHGGTFNIGTGQQTTVTEVHKLIADVLGSAASPCTCGGEKRRIAGDRPRYNEGAKGARLGPRVDLLDGIARTIEWLHGELAPEPRRWSSRDDLRAWKR